MTSGELGQMYTPTEGRAPLPGVTWAADNGCFGNRHPGDARWIKALIKVADDIATTAPC